MARSNRRKQQRQKKEAKRRRAILHRQQLQKIGKSVALRKVLNNVDSYPIRETLIADMSSLGQGPVFLSRDAGNNQVAVGVFLVDTYLMGVKNAFVKLCTEQEYRSLKRKSEKNELLLAGEPEYARKLVEDSIRYAGNFGFHPDPAYGEARRIFGSIDASACNEEFTFGKDGKPYYLQGFRDSLAKIRRIMRQLIEKCGGPDGFYYTLVDLSPAEIADLFESPEE